MTALSLAQMLRAKRVGKGRWRAECPIHGGRHSGPLSITEMPDGVRLYCFGGCSKDQLLKALGLTWRDLKNDTRVDPETLRQIRAADEERKRLRWERTKLRWQANQGIDFWQRKVKVLGRSLAKWPNDKLCREFHHALEMERVCEMVWREL